MLLDALEGDRAAATDWLWSGGKAALASWGLDPDLPREAWRSAIPAEHVAFLRRLVLSHREGDYLFVHAGIRPGVTLARQTRDDLLGIRQPFLWSEQEFGVVVVHGHSTEPGAGPPREPHRSGHRRRPGRQAELRGAGGGPAGTVGGLIPTGPSFRPVVDTNIVVTGLAPYRPCKRISGGGLPCAWKPSGDAAARADCTARPRRQSLVAGSRLSSGGPKPAPWARHAVHTAGCSCSLIATPLGLRWSSRSCAPLFRQARDTAMQPAAPGRSGW